jgi:hypothetical protein
MIAYGEELVANGFWVNLTRLYFGRGVKEISRSRKRDATPSNNNQKLIRVAATKERTLPIYARYC